MNLAKIKEILMLITYYILFIWIYNIIQIKNKFKQMLNKC